MLIKTHQIQLWKLVNVNNFLDVKNIIKKQLKSVRCDNIHLLSQQLRGGSKNRIGSLRPPLGYKRPYLKKTKIKKKKFNEC